MTTTQNDVPDYRGIDVNECEHTAQYRARVAAELPARCAGCGEVTA